MKEIINKFKEKLKSDGLWAYFQKPAIQVL